MWQSIRQLDHILRGETTTLPALRAGSLDAPAGAMPLVLILLAVIYGVCVAVQMAGFVKEY